MTFFMTYEEESPGAKSFFIYFLHSFQYRPIVFLHFINLRLCRCMEGFKSIFHCNMFPKRGPKVHIVLAYFFTVYRMVNGTV